MEIRHRQEISDTGVDPFLACSSLALWAVTITAGIIGDAGPATLIAGIDMTTKSGRPAGFYRSHDALFAAA